MPTKKTPEAQLQAIIEAQVKGGQPLFKFLLTEIDGFDGPHVLIKGHDIECFHILEILLDPEGLKAAYGEEVKTITYNDSIILNNPAYIGVAEITLRAWLTEGPTAAISTAYDLLP